MRVGKQWVRGGGEDGESHEMQQQIVLSGRSDCFMMEGEIGEEAKSSAHRSAGAGINPASHNTRLLWRQTCRRAYS